MVFSETNNPRQLAETSRKENHFNYLYNHALNISRYAFHFATPAAIALLSRIILFAALLLFIAMNIVQADQITN